MSSDIAVPAPAESPRPVVRVLRVVAIVLALYPLVALGALYILYYLGWTVLGRWPMYMADDPAGIGGPVDRFYRICEVILALGPFVLLANLAVVVVVLCLNSRAVAEKVGRALAGVYAVLPYLLFVATWPLAYLVGMYGPGEVFNWFLD